MKVHVWCPGCDPQSGGIEKYSLFFSRALAELVGGDAVGVFAKNDSTASLHRNLPGINLRAGTDTVPLSLRTPAYSALLVYQAAIERPDLIISTHLNFSPLARWLKSRWAIPYWISLHGVEAWQLTRTERVRGIISADLLLPVSRVTRDRLTAEHQFSSDKVRVLPNTFEPAAFRIESKPAYLLERYGLSPDQAVILTVGRLAAAEAYKGHDRILRVLSAVRNDLSEVRDHGTEVKYLIVGEGGDRPRLEGLARKLAVSDSVVFAGQVPARELNDHYNLCDLFAMPSTGEGFGIVFLEALACGKPVLAGNGDASVDVLCDGELGILIDPHNLVELRDAIVSILSGRDRHPLVYQPQALRQRVIEYFAYDKFKASLAGYLEEFSASKRTENSSQGVGAEKVSYK